MRTYGFSDEDIAIVEPTNAVALADPPPLKDGSLEDDLNAALADDQLQDQAIEALRPVFELMEQSAGYPELMEKNCRYLSGHEHRPATGNPCESDFY